MKLLKINIVNRFIGVCFLITLLLFLLPEIELQTPTFNILGLQSVLAFNLDENSGNDYVPKNAAAIIPQTGWHWMNYDQTAWLIFLSPEVEHDINMRTYQEIIRFQSYISDNHTLSLYHFGSYLPVKWGRVKYKFEYNLSDLPTFTSTWPSATFLTPILPQLPISFQFSSQNSVSKEVTSSPDKIASITRWLFVGGLGISWIIILALVVSLILVIRKRHSSPTTTNDVITSASYQILGNIAMEQGKYQLAEQCYRKVIEIEPYNQEIHHEFGIFLFQTERYTEAIKELHLALKSAIISPETYNYLACAYLKTQQLDKAEKYHHKALEFMSNDVLPSSVRPIISSFQKRDDIVHQH